MDSNRGTRLIMLFVLALAAAMLAAPAHAVGVAATSPADRKRSTAAGGWRFKIAGGPGVGFRVMVPSIDANFIRSTSSSADLG
jgi:hypothetical protein